eukprot:m.196386 g.196386  ORF g.196386 m.196386 type:complete len:867 (+) comp10085_c3_seq1:39-2639(+)
MLSLCGERSVLDAARGIAPHTVILREGSNHFGRAPPQDVTSLSVSMDDVRKPNVMVSRHHATIVKTGDAFKFSCLGVNGALINGTRVKEADLADGDIIVFGGISGKVPLGAPVKDPLSMLVYRFSKQVTVDNKPRMPSAPAGESAHDVHRPSAASDLQTPPEGTAHHDAAQTATISTQEHVGAAEPTPGPPERAHSSDVPVARPPAPDFESVTSAPTTTASSAPPPAVIPPTDPVVTTARAPTQGPAPSDASSHGTVQSASADEDPAPAEPTSVPAAASTPVPAPAPAPAPPAPVHVAPEPIPQAAPQPAPVQPAAPVAAPAAPTETQAEPLAPADGAPSKQPPVPSAPRLTQEQIQQLEGQMRHHQQGRAMIIGQLQQLRGHVAHNRAVMPREVLANMAQTDQQMCLHIAQHEREILRLGPLLAAAAAAARAEAASADVRALQLQAGQMHSAIKALTRDISALAAVQDKSAARRMQLLKTQRIQIVMQLASMKRQLAALDSNNAARTEEGPAGYNDMMSPEEKQLLINIQKMQMHSDNPFIDDYYFMMFVRQRTHLPLPVPMQPPREREQTAEAPAHPARTTISSIHMENTLGAITYSNVRAPRTLIEVAPNDGEAVPAHTDTWKEALRAIEGGYTALLRVSDIDRMAENPASDRKALFEQRKAILGSALAALGIGAGLDRSDTVLRVGKGARLLARLERVLFPEQFMQLLAYVLTSTAAIPNEAANDLGRSLAARIKDLPLPAIVGAINAVAAARASETPLRVSPFQTALVTCLIFRINHILAAPQSPPPPKELLEAAERLLARLAGTFVNVLGNKCEPAMWQLAALLAAHVSEAARAKLRESLKNAIERDAADASLAPMVRSI